MDDNAEIPLIHNCRRSERLFAKRVARSERLLRKHRARLFARDPHKAIEDLMAFGPVERKGDPSGLMDFVELVQTHGTALNSMKTTTGMTPLHYACKRGWGECAELLVARGADVSATDVFKCRPLWYAVYAGCVRCVRAVLGDRLDNPPVSRLGGFLFMSVSSHREEMVRVLLAAGAGVGKLANDGKWALHLAVILGYVEMVRALVEARVDHTGIVYGLNVIEAARLFGQVEVEDWLTERFADELVAKEVVGGNGDDAGDAAGPPVHK